MGKHGRDKKRRSGRTGRTTLKTHAYRRFKPPKYTDKTVREHWDPSKSPATNMKLMGLKANINEAVQQEQQQQQQKKPDIRLFDIPLSDSLSKSKKLPLGTNDQIYMAKCMKKYGTDYEKMARDIKVNVMQHTTHKLSKMGSRFLLLTEEQRRVEVPETINHLIQKD